jgi:hypothetical protein
MSKTKLSNDTRAFWSNSCRNGSNRCSFSSSSCRLQAPRLCCSLPTPLQCRCSERSPRGRVIDGIRTPLWKECQVYETCSEYLLKWGNNIFIIDFIITISINFFTNLLVRLSHLKRDKNTAGLANICSTYQLRRYVRNEFTRCSCDICRLLVLFEEALVLSVTRHTPAIIWWFVWCLNKCAACCWWREQREQQRRVDVYPQLQRRWAWRCAGALVAAQRRPSACHRQGAWR